MEDPKGQILHEVPGTMRVYKSGQVDRFLFADRVPASVDTITGVASKDTVIDPITGVSARLYLPKLSGDPRKKLPVLVYYHPGAFCIGSSFDPLFHSYLNSLVAKANVVAVSVEYRLAPEHPLPAAYDDSWLALHWVASHAAGGGPEGWLTDHADFGRVFLGGDSCGGTISSQMAMKAGDKGLPSDVKIKGIAVIQPYILGPEVVESELLDPMMDSIMKALWKVACPAPAELDDPMINPMAESAPSLAGLACEKVMVCVAEKDTLRDWGRKYCEVVKKSGYKGVVEMVEVEGKGHCFHFFDPTCEEALALGEKICSFINSD